MPTVLAAAVVLLVSTCNIGLTSGPISVAGPIETTSTTLLPLTTTSTPTTTTLRSSAGNPLLPVASDVLITPTGVPVSLVSAQNGVYRVITPCGLPLNLRQGTPFGAVDVVIDPGHGGEADPGAVGPNGLRESTVNLRVSRRVQDLLTDAGIPTVLTRTGDYTVTIGRRAAFADHAGADLMVSVHHNAPTANLGSHPGSEVFVQQGSRDSRRLGGLLYAHITAALSSFDDVLWSTSPDAGVLEVLNSRGVDAYGMLRSPETTTALAELAYISNRPEAELLATGEYVEVAANSVASAIIDYLTTEDIGSGYGNPPRVFSPARGISSAVCEDPDLS